MLTITPSASNVSSIHKQQNLHKIAFTGKHNSVHKHKSSSPITIHNYHHVDDIVSRGAKPSEKQVKELAKNGFKHIISFCTNYDPQKGYLGMPEEAKWADKNGIKFHWFPFNAKKNPSKKQVKDFFDITDNARINNEKVFIHCRHGADRTGVFSAIYKIRNYHANLESIYKEMFKYGHDANLHNNLIPFVAKFKHDNMFNLKGILIHILAQAKKSIERL